MDSLTTWNIAAMPALIALILGYLSGSVPFGLILTRLAGLGDVRSIGSGNIGATNVLRTGNKKLAAATLLLDAVKGTVPAALAYAFLGVEAGVIAGFAAFIGHIFPVWLGFKGGKGVATYIGVMFGLNWRMGLLFLLVWIATAAITRYSSLSALVAMLVVPVVQYLTGDPKIAAVAAVMTVIAYAKHHANISRLLSGTESKIGKKG
ncbi:MULTISPECIES: glycerol-3-phosphate 1-O-acyltransferase PlsY [unclassified Rhizobium]|uniref:glycerol-3-phosphate 1-O-acyltransferase PlsY n=1 Tax=unclassified Rhizobium TaxID=2613769 RepID=UPI0016043A46|nr:MULTISPECIES: glycerol-3-phosphate 1-O-acyltransferase PlsY [unclassified Rhizobium]MBB1247519.1 glycerol-3-phosphate 1-O-acyltransferase PlsY [Rhizobium sp. G21]MCV3764222.1 glycerol-3-phosphate 1-O-acyltransferase PlsY [Rhizobium sp. TRM95796]